MCECVGARMCLRGRGGKLCGRGGASGPWRSSFAYLQSGQTSTKATSTTVTSLQTPFPFSLALFPLSPHLIAASVFPASVKEPILSEVEYLNYLLPQLLSVLLFVSWVHYQPSPPNPHPSVSAVTFPFLISCPRVFHLHLGCPNSVTG